MQTLKGNTVHLRALEPEDLQFLFDSENNEDHWEVSCTQTPFSKFLLEKYLENAHQDIYEAKQLRLVIASNKTSTPMGMIDLFDFDPLNRRAGIGILIEKEFQGKGIAKEALRLLISYAFHYLNVHQLFANITTDNKTSIALFESFKFECVGIKKDWIFANPNYKDEALYQLIHKIEG
ncbi:GNAT family N-acetyltransferase [Bacteroidota bacterium]